MHLCLNRFKLSEPRRDWLCQRNEKEPSLPSHGYHLEQGPFEMVHVRKSIFILFPVLLGVFRSLRLDLPIFVPPQTHIRPTTDALVPRLFCG